MMIIYVLKYTRKELYELVGTHKSTRVATGNRPSSCGISY